MAIKLPLLVFILGISFNCFALEKMSCDDLIATANDLDYIADGFYAESSTIRENDEADIALRDLVDVLHIIAASEQEKDLSLYVTRLDRAWKDMDSDNFAAALEDTIDSFDRLIRRDCN